MLNRGCQSMAAAHYAQDVTRRTCVDRIDDMKGIEGGLAPVCRWVRRGLADDEVEAAGGSGGAPGVVVPAHHEVGLVRAQRHPPEWG